MSFQLKYIRDNKSPHAEVLNTAYSYIYTHTYTYILSRQKFFLSEQSGGFIVTFKLFWSRVSEFSKEFLAQ